MAVLSPSPPSKIFACGMAWRNFWLVPEGSIFVRFLSHDAPDGTKFEQSALGAPPLNEPGPNTLTYCSDPEYGFPFGSVAGRSGLPNESTDAIVGLLPVLTVCELILPGFQPDQ